MFLLICFCCLQFPHLSCNGQFNHIIIKRIIIFWISGCLRSPPLIIAGLVVLRYVRIYSLMYSFGRSFGWFPNHNEVFHNHVLCVPTVPTCKKRSVCILILTYFIVRILLYLDNILLLYCCIRFISESGYNCIFYCECDFIYCIILLCIFTVINGFG